MLPDLQHDMMDVITGDGTVSAPKTIISNDISRDERLNIHRNHYRLSLKQALADNFPVCTALVGEEFFRACMDPFLNTYPPKTRELHRYGDDLPGFFDQFPPVQQHVPWLGDVARIERAVAACWHSDRHPALNPALLTRLAPEEAAALTLVPQMCCRLLHSPTAAISVWQAHRDGMTDREIQIDSGPEFGLIWRDGQHVLARQCSKAEYLFLQSLHDGHSLEQAIESAFTADNSFAFAAALQGAFARGDFYRFAITNEESQNINRGEPIS